MGVWMFKNFNLLSTAEPVAEQEESVILGGIAPFAVMMPTLAIH
jgi:hypothetical protein